MLKLLIALGHKSEQHKGFKMAELKVLVVDDEKDIADGMAACCKKWGHDTRIAYNGKEAITISIDYQPHVVLLDIIMPDLDGYKVAKEITLNCRDSIIIGATALSLDENRHMGWDCGFRYYFTKPIDPNEIKKVLANIHRSVEVAEKLKKRQQERIEKRVDNSVARGTMN